MNSGDAAIMFIVSISYQSFGETFMYVRSSITMEEVRCALLSKESIDKELFGEIG